MLRARLPHHPRDRELPLEASAVGTPRSWQPRSRSAHIVKAFIVSRRVPGFGCAGGWLQQARARQLPLRISKKSNSRQFADDHHRKGAARVLRCEKKTEETGNMTSDLSAGRGTFSTSLHPQDGGSGERARRGPPADVSDFHLGLAWVRLRLMLGASRSSCATA